MSKNYQKKMAKGSINEEQGTITTDPKLYEILGHYTLDEIKDYKDREEKVCFPTSFGPNWKGQFKTKDAVNKLFQDLRITDQEIIEINSAPALSEDRLTLFLTTRNLETGIPTRAIIDFISGSPTWEQFIDVTYDSGAGTGLKIIIYDEDSDMDESKPAGYSVHINNLVEKNNRCGVRTFLVHARFLIRKEGKILAYVIDQGPYIILEGMNQIIPVKRPDNLEILPTKRQVQEAEFWVAYNYPHWISRGFEDLGLTFDVTGPLGTSISVGDDLEARAFWDDNGLSIRLTSRRKPEDLYRVWNDGKQTLMDKFSECTIDFQPDSEEGPVMTFNVFEIPMSELISMDVEDKRYYGEEAYDVETYLEYVVECILAGEEVR